MREGRALAPRWREVVPLLLGILLLVASVLVIVMWARIAAGIDVRVLLLDPGSLIAGWLPYTSAISYAGMLLWWASAIVGLFGGALLWREERGIALVLVAMGVLSATRTLDELFAVHREAAIALTRAAGASRAPLAADALTVLFFVPYAIAVVVCVARARAVVARTDVLLLTLAIAAFAASALVDLAADAMAGVVASVGAGAEVTMVADELLELTGTLFWCAYVTRTALVRTRAAMEGPAWSMDGGLSSQWQRAALPEDGAGNHPAHEGDRAGKPQWR